MTMDRLDRKSRLDSQAQSCKREHFGSAYIGNCLIYLADTLWDIYNEKLQIEKERIDLETKKAAALKQYAEDEYLRNRSDL